MIINKKESALSYLQVTRGYGLLEEFLAIERNKLANRLIPQEYRDGSILDIGCGSFPYFLLHTKFSKKYGLDKVIRKDYDKKFRDYKIHFVHFNIGREGKIPFKDSYFDVVTMLAVAEHFRPNILGEIFKDIYRVLKQGGMFLLTTPSIYAAPLLRAMAKVRLISPIEIREHKYAYSHSQIFSILQKANFSMEKKRAGYFFLNTWTSVIK